MKQVFNKRGEVVVGEVMVPLAGNDTLVQNAYSVISTGTESASIKGSSENIAVRAARSPETVKEIRNRVTSQGIYQTANVMKNKYEELRLRMSPLGYSSAGVVIEKGINLPDINIGDKVACARAIYGNHADVILVQKNLLVKVPDSTDLKEAAFTTLGSIAMQGVRRARVEFGETVVILGLGLVGQLAAQIARAAGCRTIGIDLLKLRVERARELGLALGITQQNQEDSVRMVLDYTGAAGADAVLICADTKSSTPVNQAMQMARKKGRVVAVGAVGMNLKRDEFYKKELDFMISTSYGPGRYDPIYEEKGIDYPIGYVRWTENRNMQEFVRMLAEGKVNVRKLIDHEFPIEEAPRAYQIINKEKPLGVLFRYKESGKVTRKVVFDLKPKAKARKTVNIGLIGTGSFAKAYRLPNLSKIPECNIRAIASATGSNARQIAERYQVEYAVTDYQEIFKDPGIDAVLIATRHNLHASIAVEAAKAGKDIFIEKPMAINYEELEELKKTVADTGITFAVGFNRRYSPLAVKAKELLREKRKPYLINYRVNAGFVPEDNWIQDKSIGGGRIIGECSHFFDMFNYLIEAEVVKIKAIGISANNKSVVADDNVAVTVSYSDGSLSVLTYVALGHTALSKERIEIFADGSSLVIDDFRRLETYGFAKNKTISIKQDKGYHAELVEFLKAMKGHSSNLITLEDCIRATEMSLAVQQEICRE
ncbi:bi-domain-containing oxidoreductase [Chloroflexota bacterium]